MGTCMEPHIRGHQITHWIKDGTDDRYGYEWCLMEDSWLGKSVMDIMGDT